MEHEPQTASELMMENQMNETVEPIKTEPSCVLPHEDVQKFLLEVISQANFPGHMVEFVCQVKSVIKTAKILGV